jgi:hypothetical protein
MSDDREHATNCCHTEHQRLLKELDACDRNFAHPRDWHRCARTIARNSGERAKRCIRQV